MAEKRTAEVAKYISPAGIRKLSDEALEKVIGGTDFYYYTMGTLEENNSQCGIIEKPKP